LKAAEGFKSENHVKISIVVEKKTLSRQISALHHIQENCLEQRRQFLWGQNYREAEAKNIYDSLSAEQLDEQLSALPL